MYIIHDYVIMLCSSSSDNGCYMHVGVLYIEYYRIYAICLYVHVHVDESAEDQYSGLHQILDCMGRVQSLKVHLIHCHS